MRRLYRIVGRNGRAVTVSVLVTSDNRVTAADDNRVTASGDNRVTAGI